MVHHIALGILSTASGAGIAALLLLAGSVRRAIRVQHALRTTAFIGVSEVVRKTLTRSSAIPLDALRVGAAGRGLARIDDLYIGHNGLALGEGISGETHIANAHGRVGDDATDGTDTA